MIQQKNNTDTLNNLKNCLAFLLFVKSTLLFSQNDIKLGSAGVVKPISSPTQVQATDGTYADRIDVSWQYAGGEYLIYRSDDVANIGKPINTTWQRANYLSDRAILQSGKKYYYRVKMRQNGHESALSKADIGHLMPIAGGRVIETETLSTPPPIEFSINHLENDTLATGKPFDVIFILENKGNSPTQSSNARFYLSDKENSDKNAILLQESPIAPLSIGRIKRGAVSLIIPKAVTQGTYFLIMTLDKQSSVVSKKITVR